MGTGGAILVIGLLIALELLGDGSSRWQSELRHILKIATAPLAFVFGVSIVAKVIAAVA